MTRSRQFAAPLLLAILSLTYACKQDESIPAADLITIRQGQLISLPAGSQLFSDTIVVTACPPSAYCIAPNLVSVSLRFVSGTQSRLIRLFAPSVNYKRLRGIDYDSTGLALGGTTYKIILREGRYATSSSTTKTDEAIIQVTRL